MELPDGSGGAYEVPGDAPPLISALGTLTTEGWTVEQREALFVQVAEVVETGQPQTQLIACRLCGVLLWNVEQHSRQQHPVQFAAAYNRVVDDI